MVLAAPAHRRGPRRARRGGAAGAARRRRPGGGRARDPQGHAAPAPRGPVRLRRRPTPPWQRSTRSSTRSPGAGSRRRRGRRSRWRSSTSPARRPGEPLWALLGASRGDPGRAATRPWSPGARRGRRGRRALGGARLRDLQAQGRRRRRRRPGARGARGASAPRRGSASTPTAPGASTRRSGVLRMVEPLGDRARRAAGRPTAEMAEVTARPRSRSPPTRASSAPRTPSGRSATRRLRPGDGEARRRSAASARRTGSPGRCRSTSRARSTARSGSPPRRTPPRRCRPTARRPGSPTGSRPSCCSRPRSPARECALDGGAARRRPTGPGLGVEIDEDGARPSAADLAFGRRWTRPTATPRSPRRSSRSSPRCGVRDAVICPGSRSTPLALALWREPAIEARVIVDERSRRLLRARRRAGDRHARSPSLCTSGTAAANLHPAVCEADESAVPLIVLTADRPPELRGIGAGQTIDQLKLYGSAVRWFCEVGTHDADDAGLLHFRSVACRAFCDGAGRPAARAGAPERRLARPARPRAASRRRHRDARRWRSRAASERPLTTVAAGAVAAGPSRSSTRSPSGIGGVARGA